MAEKEVKYISAQPWTDLIKIEPSQFDVHCELNREHHLQLSLANRCASDHIAWKLKTNRPGRYMVSPKQGIIGPTQRTDITIVLSKLKQVPDTKKPDKFLIEATKIPPVLPEASLQQLWKDREAKHDKKRGVFALQAVTIKCRLNVDLNSASQLTDIAEGKESRRNGASSSADDRGVVIVSKEETPPKALYFPKPDNSAVISPMGSAGPPSNAVDDVSAATAAAVAAAMGNSDGQNNAATAEQLTSAMDNNSAVATDGAPKPKPSPQQSTISAADNGAAAGDGAESGGLVQPSPTTLLDPKTVEEWKRKATEYDELFNFCRITLGQRDQLQSELKCAQESERNLKRKVSSLEKDKQSLAADIEAVKQSTAQRSNNGGDNDDSKNESLIDAMDKHSNKGTNGPSFSTLDNIDRIVDSNGGVISAQSDKSAFFSLSVFHVLFTIIAVIVAYILGTHFNAPF